MDPKKFRKILKGFSVSAVLLLDQWDLTRSERCGLKESVEYFRSSPPRQSHLQRCCFVNLGNSETSLPPINPVAWHSSLVNIYSFDIDTPGVKPIASASSGTVDVIISRNSDLNFGTGPAIYQTIPSATKRRIA